MNSEIGVLPPGLISNEEDLFESVPKEECGLKELKQDLRVNINYRAVNPFVWYLFYVNYGGIVGSSQIPQVPREAIDIYSKDMA